MVQVYSVIFICIYHLSNEFFNLMWIYLLFIFLKNSEHDQVNKWLSINLIE
jgi:hypothetical protein